MVRCAVVAAFGLLAACASSEGPADAGGAQRISAGMQRLGATETRGACYGERLASSLDGRDEDEAARLVEKASNKEEMRSGVLSANGRVRKAFIGASMRCSRT